MAFQLPSEPPVEVTPWTTFSAAIGYAYVFYWYWVQGLPVPRPPPDIDGVALGLGPARGSRLIDGRTVVAASVRWVDNIPPDVAFVFTERIVGGPPLRTPGGQHYTRLIITYNGTIGAASARYRVAFYR